MSGLEICGLYLIFVVFALNYWRFKDVLYPPVIQGAVWFLVLLIYVSNESSLEPVSSGVFFILANGVVCFSLGSYLSTAGYRRRPIFLRAPAHTSETLVSQMAFWLAVLGLPLFAAQAVRLAEGGPTDFFLLNIRHSLIADQSAGTYGAMWYLLTLSFFSCACEFYRNLYQPNVFRATASFVIALTYAILSTGRTFVLLLVMSLAGIAAISRKVRPSTIAVRVAIAVLIIFLGFAYLLQKGMGADKPFLENIEGMSEHVKIYTLGYLPALDKDLGEDKSLEYGEYTFRTLWAVAEKLGFEVEARHWDHDLQYVEMRLNSQWRSIAMADHTVYQPYLKDFGVPGVLIIPLLLGILHGYIYKRADSGQPIYLLAYGLSFYPLFLQFFQDQYLTLFSLWLQMGTLLVLHFTHLTGLGRRRAMCET